MGALLVVLGTAILTVTLYDALTTTIAVSVGPGPLTHRIGRGIWWGLRRYAHTPRSFVLVLGAPMIIGATTITWLGGLWVGWTLIFTASPTAVIDSTTGAPVGLIERFYFTATTLFTLGPGDVAPSGSVWRILTALATINGLALATLAISYLIPLITAATERRQQAATISSYGCTVEEILRLAWDGTDFKILEHILPDIVAETNRVTQRHLSYPVLHYFHSRDRLTAFAPALAVIDEVVTLLAAAVPESVRPHRAILHATREAVAGLLDVTVDELHLSLIDDPPAVSDGGLPALGVPYDREAHLAAASDLAEHRSQLYAYLAESHWSWEPAVIEPASGEREGA